MVFLKAWSSLTVHGDGAFNTTWSEFKIVDYNPVSVQGPLVSLFVDVSIEWYCCPSPLHPTSYLTQLQKVISLKQVKAWVQRWNVRTQGCVGDVWKKRWMWVFQLTGDSCWCRRLQLEGDDVRKWRSCSWDHLCLYLMLPKLVGRQLVVRLWGCALQAGAGRSS